MQGKAPFSPVQNRGPGVLVGLGGTEKALHTTGHPECKGTNRGRVGIREHRADGDESSLLAPGYSPLSYENPRVTLSFDWFME